MHSALLDALTQTLAAAIMQATHNLLEDQYEQHQPQPALDMSRSPQTSICHECTTARGSIDQQQSYDYTAQLLSLPASNAPEAPLDADLHAQNQQTSQHAAGSSAMTLLTTLQLPTIVSAEVAALTPTLQQTPAAASLDPLTRLDALSHSAPTESPVTQRVTSGVTAAPEQAVPAESLAAASAAEAFVDKSASMLSASALLDAPQMNEQALHAEASGMDIDPVNDVAPAGIDSDHAVDVVEDEAGSVGPALASSVGADSDTSAHASQTPEIIPQDSVQGKRKWQIWTANGTGKQWVYNSSVPPDKLTSKMKRSIRRRR